MTAAQLRIKSKLFSKEAKRNGATYYVHLEWYDERGYRHRSDVPTGFTVDVPKAYKGGKKSYNAEVEEKRKQIEAEYQSKLLTEAELRAKPQATADRILFSDWMTVWLNHVIDVGKDNGEPLAETTIYGYKRIVNSAIIPYFKEKGLMLSAIDRDVLEAFYRYKREVDGLSVNSTKHFHANIRRALDYAVEQKQIPSNPAYGIKFSIAQVHHEIYNEDQLQTLASYVRGTELEAPIFLASSFGMRRGEILGLRWSSINFKYGFMTVDGELFEYDRNGTNLHWQRRTKSRKSARSFWLTEDQIEYFKKLKVVQEQRRSNPEYNKDWSDFVCVDEKGNIIKPGYITHKFPILTEKAGLPRLKLHELRHTCLSLLIIKGFDIKLVSEYAGHSTIAITADTYGHLPSMSSKPLVASMSSLFRFSDQA
jgi:integrase